MTTDERLDRIEERNRRMEELLLTLVKQKTIKDWYSTSEFAEIVQKAEWTIRENCRTGRLKADKRQTGRGRSLEWMLSHEELTRYQNEGLLPDPSLRRRLR